MFITMPQLGETVTEGTIVRWCKAVGDVVAEDEPLFEVSTDKVDTEVPSAVAGVLSEILVAEGDTAAIGTRLAVVRSDQDHPTADGTGATTAVAEPESTSPTVDAPPAPRAPVGDAPRRGDRTPGALVSRADVVARIEARERPLARPAAAPGGPVGQDGRRHDAGERPAVVPVAGAGDRVEPLSSVRRATGEHMRRSITTAAHTLVVMEADYSRVDRARAAVKEEFRTREGFGLTYLPFVARAVVDAIGEYPRVNASVGADALIVHPAVHLGIAVDLEFEGLIVPVVRDAGVLRLRALASAIHDRTVRAHARSLTPDDVAGGTFTLSNAGGHGTLVTAPIISQPQVAIISTDGVTPRPVAVPTGDGQSIAVHPVGNLSMSFDHRAFDGAYASAFLRCVVEHLATRDWIEELA